MISKNKHNASECQDEECVGRCNMSHEIKELIYHYYFSYLCEISRIGYFWDFILFLANIEYFNVNLKWWFTIWEKLEGALMGTIFNHWYYFSYPQDFMNLLDSWKNWLQIVLCILDPRIFYLKKRLLWVSKLI